MNAPEINGAEAARALDDATPAFAHRTHSLARAPLGGGADPHPGRGSAVATATVVELPEMPEPHTADPS